MFIVIEGIDGAGKGRQRSELVAHLSDLVPELTTVDFPDHNSPIYEELIHPALHEERELTPAGWFLSFALDQILWQKKIAEAVGSKEKYFIVDGYFTTTLVYQCILNEFYSLDKALEFADMFEMPKPDMVVYLEVDPEVAMGRKQDEEGHEEGLDIFERSLEKQKKINAGFLKLAETEKFGNWEVIDGNGTIEEVRANIIKVLEDKNII